MSSTPSEGLADGAWAGVEGPERLPVPLRPFTVPDVLDGGIATLKVAPRQMLQVTAPFVIPVQVLSAIVLRVEQGGDLSLRDSFSSGSEGVFAHNFTGGLVAVALVSSLALTFAGAAAARLICSWYVDAPISPRAALGAVLRRSPAVFGLWLIVHLAEVAAGIPLIFTSVFVVPFFVAAAPILAVEGIGPWKAFRRCFALTRRRYGFVFGVVVMVAVLATVIGLVIDVLSAGIAALVDLTASGLDLSGNWSWVVAVAVSAASALVVVPFVAATAALVYLDLRVRNEGLDIELAAIEQFGDQ